MTRTTVREDWESFVDAVLPADAPAYQRREMRRAFYAGFHACLCVAMKIGEPDVTEDAGVEWIESLRHELKAFQQRVGRDA